MKLKVPAGEAVDEVQRHLPDRLRWLTDISVAGNELWRIAALAGSILIALMIGRLLRIALNVASRRFEASSRKLLAVAFSALARACGFIMFVVGLEVGLQFLVLNPTVDSASQLATTVLMTIALGYAAYCLVDVAEQGLRKFSNGRASKLDDMLAPLVTTSLRVTVVILVLVQIATTLSDKPVTSVIAGLGVGGLAIGLAAQDTIKNFFGSLMIFTDRPFELGDEIKVGDVSGVIESVGFRSTRFRTDQGFLVTMPNGDLASKTIINISKRHELGRQFNLSLNYDLPPEKVERAVAVVKEILRDHEGLQPGSPPRVFLGELTASACNLSIAYWYSPPDWWRFVAFNERVNLEILRRFRAEQISFAQPTQTVFLKGEAESGKSEGGSEKSKG